MRKLFGLPLRKDTTQEMYPDKIHIKDFCEIIRMSIDDFEENLTKPQEERYIEEWFETLGVWLDIEGDKRCPN